MDTFLCGVLTVFLLRLATGQIVYLPPVITEQPAEETLFTAGAAQIKLYCQAKGVPMPSIQWKKVTQGGDELSLDKSRIVIQVTPERTTLLINRPVKGDEGLYQCIADGGRSGTAMSRAGIVREGYLKPVSLSEEIIPARAGDSLQLPCSGPNSYPKAKYHWLRLPNAGVDSPHPPVQITTNRRVAITEQGNLLFTFVSQADMYDGLSFSGWHYACVSYNPAIRKSEIGRPIKLNITGAEPRTTPMKLLYKNRSPVIAVAGRPFTLNCVFGGKPAPTVKIDRPKDFLMPPRERLFETVDQTVLNIRRVEPTDAGSWRCTGTQNNGAKAKEEFIDVQVETPPIWVKAPRNMNVSVGSNATFDCEPTGNPIPSIQFYINSKKISGSRMEYELKKNKLIFLKVKKPDSLVVMQCRIQNKHGTIYKSGYLNVLDNLVVVKQPLDSYVLSEDNKQASMICHVSSDPSDPVDYMWLKDGKELGESLVYSTSVTNRQSTLTVSMNRAQKGETEMDFVGSYSCVARTRYNGWQKEVHGYRLQYLKSAVHDVTSNSNMSSIVEPKVAALAGPWYVAVIVGAVVLIIIIILILCMLLRQGETYPVGKKERAAGHDPTKDDSGFHDYVRPCQEPTKGTDSSPSSLDDSFSSDYKPAYDDGLDSVIGMDDIDPGKFNEDGSFIGAYGDEEPENTPAKIGHEPYLFQNNHGVSVFI